MSAAVGIGARAGASAATIERLARQAQARAGVAADALCAPRRIESPALAEAAARLGLPLRLCEDQALREAGPRVISHSARVEALFGVGSVAEAAALVGAGPGARVAVAKFSDEGVSCALALGEP